MNEQKFSLQPFASDNLLPDVQITGNIARNAHQLAVTYNLLGDLTEIIIASPSDTPTRKHELWEDTCFEFFVGIVDSQRYWEFNLSPAGHWNVYRFDGYRQGMQEETAFTNLPFLVEHQANLLALNLSVDLTKIVSSEPAIDVAITTVVKQKSSQISYWALAHKGTEADFHLRDSVLILL
ncbi:DOMON-like domain-containing protein [Fortiea sp. LEGE XX443]|uniref:DOMON-like domain-containing protein n=1 Tax=Fortiea sp. LEGE XX443 TaxID=1828611 RepID=UPI001881FBD4|nr:DOMON-like domain-containing protein [Fortiea sp. LEGE XX443]MBE9006143.1 DOMON-like domain-containing protein [Fortiea sp. LEGE XX443]